MLLVVLPQALRMMIPPLTSQYLNIIKSSTLGAAIAYPEIVQIFAGTVLNQSGRAIEVIVIVMGVFLSINLAVSALMNWYNRASLLVPNDEPPSAVAAAQLAAAASLAGLGATCEHRCSTRSLTAGRRCLSLVVPPFVALGARQATLSGPATGRPAPARRLLGVRHRRACRCSLWRLPGRAALAPGLGLRPAGRPSLVPALREQRARRGWWLLLLLMLFPLLARRSCSGAAFRACRYVDTSRLGRADAQHRAGLRRRRRRVAAGHPAGAGPTLAVAGGSRRCRSASSSSGAACRCSR